MDITVCTVSPWLLPAQVIGIDLIHHCKADTKICWAPALSSQQAGGQSAVLRLQATLFVPSNCIHLQAFDELLLLKRGGETIYNGKLGEHSADLIKYFSVSFVTGFCHNDASSKERAQATTVF